MRIFRGPVTKPFADSEHELVADIDTGKSATFVQDALVLVANVTKDPTERQAVAHIEIGSTDLLALHQRFITGLAARARESDQLKARMALASQKLYRLYERLREGSAFEDTEGRLGDLESILEHACDTVGTLAADLDFRA